MRFDDTPGENQRTTPCLRVGKRVEVLIDEVDEDGAIGRTQYDAPEVDGRAAQDGLTELPPGTLLEAEITTDEHDMWAEPA